MKRRLMALVLACLLALFGAMPVYATAGDTVIEITDDTTATLVMTCATGQTCSIALTAGHTYAFNGREIGYNKIAHSRVTVSMGNSGEWINRTYGYSYDPVLCFPNPMTYTSSGTTWQIVGNAQPNPNTNCIDYSYLYGTAVHTAVNNGTIRATSTKYPLAGTGALVSYTVP